MAGAAPVVLVCSSSSSSSASESEGAPTGADHGAHVTLEARTGPLSGRAVMLAPNAVIGRGSAPTDKQAGAALAKLRLPDPEVSRKHARLTLVDRTWHVQDLCSLNGTLLNDLPLESGRPQRLGEGDVLEVGTSKMAVVACTCKTCLATANDRQKVADARCVVCAKDLAAEPVEAQNAHMQACLREAKRPPATAKPGATRAADKLTEKAKARAKAKAKANSKDGQLTLGRPGPSNSNASRKRARDSRIQCAAFEGSVAQAKERLRILDSRVEQLEEYRAALRKYIAQAEQLDAVLVADENKNEAEATASALFGDVEAVKPPAPTSSQAPSPVLLCIDDDDDDEDGGSGGGDAKAEDEEDLGEEDHTRRPWTPPPASPPPPTRPGRGMWAATCATGTLASPSVFRNAVLADREPPRKAPETRPGQPPAFEELGDEELRRLLAENGMESGPRVYMVEELKRLWRATQPAEQPGGAPKEDQGKQKKSESKEQAEQRLNIAICSAITRTLANERLYEDILLNKQLNFATIHGALKRSGVQVGQKRLRTFLDCHGVTYRS